MRGTKAKAMRRADPSRPNPGRLQGGYGKEDVRNNAKGFQKIENFKRRLIKGLKNKEQRG